VRAYMQTLPFKLCANCVRILDGATSRSPTPRAQPAAHLPRRQLPSSCRRT
jgi:hypothetical protein